MNNLDKAQRKIKSLARWLEDRDYCDTKSLSHSLDSTQRKIDRLANQAIDETLRNMDRFVEQARVDAKDSTLSARYRQMARTELKRLRKVGSELESLRV